MILLRNLAFYMAFYGGSVLLVASAWAAAYVAPKAVKPICDNWARWHVWCCERLLGLTIRETGTRPQGQAFYAIKHEAAFEAISMAYLFDYPAGIAKHELFDIPGWGKAGRAYGLIPVARDQGAKALRTMLREVKPVIEQGRPLIIFPEGTRVPHGTSPPLQSGFAALYKLIGLPVVPVAVDSGPIYQRWLKPKGTITLHFGEALPPGLPRHEVEERIHAAINCLNSPPDHGGFQAFGSQPMP